jgi:hypothetical protein
MSTAYPLDRCVWNLTPVAPGRTFVSGSVKPG